MKNKLLLIILCPALIIASIVCFGSPTLQPQSTGVEMCSGTIHSGVSVDMSACTDSLIPPSGTTAQRPSPCASGMQRYNTDTGLNEYCSSSLSWVTSTPPATQAYDGITIRTNVFYIYKSVTVASGLAIYNLTNDGTSTGTTLCPNNVIQNSVNFTPNDAASPYQISWAMSNANKTLTATVNKSTATVISLLGISLLAAPAAANGSVVTLQVACN